MTRSPHPAFIFLIQLLVDQKMINETDKFLGHSDNRYIAHLHLDQSLEESGQLCPSHI